MVAAAVTLLLFAVVQAPTTVPGTDAILSLLALALLGTAAALAGPAPILAGIALGSGAVRRATASDAAGVAAR